MIDESTTNEIKELTNELLELFDGHRWSVVFTAIEKAQVFMIERHARKIDEKSKIAFTNFLDASFHELKNLLENKEKANNDSDI